MASIILRIVHIRPDTVLGGVANGALLTLVLLLTGCGERPQGGSMTLVMSENPGSFTLCRQDGGVKLTYDADGKAVNLVSRSITVSYKSISGEDVRLVVTAGSGASITINGERYEPGPEGCMQMNHETVLL